MKNIFGLLIFYSLTSCSSNNPEVDERTKSISNYSYVQENSTVLVEVLHEVFANGTRVSKYPEQIKRKYDISNNLLEEAVYNLRSESPVLEHYIKNQYDTAGRLINTLDSMKMLTVRIANNYAHNQIINSKTTTTYFEPTQNGNDEIWLPVESSVDDFYYEYENSLNIVTKSIYSESGKFNSDEKQQYDSLITYHKYDMNQDQIESLVMSKNDTISVTTRKFDSSHKETEVVNSRNGVTDKLEYTYDKNSNLIASIINSKLYSEKLELSYNENNQLTQRIASRIK